jgi:hypothetical protein
VHILGSVRSSTVKKKVARIILLTSLFVSVVSSTVFSYVII